MKGGFDMAKMVLGVLLTDGQFVELVGSKATLWGNSLQTGGTLFEGEIDDLPVGVLVDLIKVGAIHIEYGGGGVKLGIS
jgi:hypothetical protein